MKNQELVLSSSDEDSWSNESWVEMFCQEEGHEFFCEVRGARDKSCFRERLESRGIWDVKWRWWS